MSCGNTIDSNITATRIAQEASLKTLPVSPVWYTREPNSYDDFGGEVSKVERDTINPSRQNQKGTITDLDADGGFVEDHTQNNMTRLLQGFFFAAAREKADTEPLNGTAVTLVDITNTDTFGAASGLDIFGAGDIVYSTGQGDGANNGMFTVASSTASTVVVNETLVNETSPAGARLRKVGVVGDTDDLSITYTASAIYLTSSTLDFTTLGLTQGEWIYVGGDTAASRFDTGSGYARISVIAANRLDFDQTTWDATGDSSTSKDIQLFFGLVIRNESDSSLIECRSYQIERELGEDANGPQAEYLEGAISNEFNMSLETASKITASLGYVAMDNSTRTGAEGIKSSEAMNTVVPVLAEQPYNTSSDVVQFRLNVVDGTSLNNDPLFAYVDAFSINISNGVTPNKSIGTLGAISTSTANFVVSGSITAFFETVEAQRAVRNNADVNFSMIAAKANGGFVYDIPLMGLGGGRLSVEKDTAVKVPLDQAAAENSWGYTLMHVNFPYLPDVAMPA